MYMAHQSWQQARYHRIKPHRIARYSNDISLLSMPTYMYISRTH